MNNVKVIRPGKNITYEGKCHICEAIISAKKSYVNIEFDRITGNCPECNSIIDFKHVVDESFR